MTTILQRQRQTDGHTTCQAIPRDAMQSAVKPTLYSVSGTNQDRAKKFSRYLLIASTYVSY